MDCFVPVNSGLERVKVRQALSPGHLPGKLLSLILPGEVWLRRTLAGEPLRCGGTGPWNHTQVGAAQVGAGGGGLWGPWSHRIHRRTPREGGGGIRTVINRSTGRSNEQEMKVAWLC